MQLFDLRLPCGPTGPLICYFALKYAYLLCGVCEGYAFVNKNACLLNHSFNEHALQVVLSDRAKSDGFEVSLMERLGKLHPERVALLTTQYRDQLCKTGFVVTQIL